MLSAQLLSTKLINIQVQLEFRMSCSVTKLLSRQIQSRQKFVCKVFFLKKFKKKYETLIESKIESKQAQATNWR